LAKSSWQREQQLCQQLGLPTASVEAVVKSAGQGCWQRSPALPTVFFANSLAKAVGKAGKAGKESPALPTAWPKAVGKAGKSREFSPFSFAFF
jgi:hypothetical protein